MTNWEVTVITNSNFIKKVRVDNCATKIDAEEAALSITGAKRVITSTPKKYKELESLDTSFTYDDSSQSSFSNDEISDSGMYLITIGSVLGLCALLWIISPVFSFILGALFTLFLYHIHT